MGAFFRRRWSTWHHFHGRSLQANCVLVLPKIAHSKGKMFDAAQNLLGRNPSVEGQQSASDGLPSAFPAEGRRFPLPLAACSVTAGRRR
jgi:hypothetical protein